MLPFLQFIIALAILIAAAKLGGYLIQRVGQPAVVGEVLAGLLLGPSVLNLYNLSIFTDTHLPIEVEHLAELGVLLLMFLAGIELHLEDLVKSGKVAIITGAAGFALTLGMGYLLASVFDFDLQSSIFIGLMLAPTSIGISAQTLMELNQLRSRVGVSLLGAAAIDDILSVLGISVFLAFFLDGSGGDFSSILLIVVKMIIFLLIASVIGLLYIPRLTRFVERLQISQGLVSFTFITVLLYAWSAEALGHMATIIGAFLAGLFFSRSEFKEAIYRGFSAIAYGVFVPIFFINVGLSADVRQIPADGLILLAGMLVVVMISKIAGAVLGGRVGRLNLQEILQVGFGMNPRGEVVLIIATVGITEGMINKEIFSIAVVLVIITTLMIPPILRYSFSKSSPPQEVELNQP
jgi:Kef-type K+ transport system membrane component KefB